MRLFLKGRLVLGALVTFTVVACQVVAGIERVDKVAAGSAEGDGGGSSSGGDGDGDSKSDGTAINPNDPCKHAAPPPLPTTDDSQTSLPPFYVALRTINLTDGDGFDLDGVCTCDTRPDTTRGGIQTCVPKDPKKTCDGDGGVDNMGASLFTTLSNAGANLNDQTTGDLNNGKENLLIYISDYNGKANDLDVSVGVVTSRGIVDGSGCGSDPTGDGHFVPKWCGHDKWTFSAADLKNGVPAPLATAYVANGELVVTAAGTAHLIFGNATLALGSSVLAGKLEPSGTTFQLTGSLSGRISAVDLLGVAGQFKDPIDPQKVKLVCQDPGALAFVTDPICTSVDIMKVKNLDTATPQLACDSISTTIHFTAEPAELGAQADDPPPNANPCTPDQFTYACP